MTPLVDPKIIFGPDTGFYKPVNFLNNKLSDYNGKQMTENRYPSAMSVCEFNLEADSSITINSLLGHVSTENRLKEIKDGVVKNDYLDKKEKVCQSIHQQVTDRILTKSNYSTLDNYSRQSYLDNIFGYQGAEENLSILELREYLKIISFKLKYAFKYAFETDYNLYSTYLLSC
ncbi:MAG: hypothetical protein ACOC4G_00310 [Bacillota bacterium]